MAVVLSNKIRMCKLDNPAANKNKHSFAALSHKCFTLSFSACLGGYIFDFERIFRNLPLKVEYMYIKQ